MRILKKSYNLSGAGLIEILIAMVIFAIAIVAITSLNAKNFRQIKANEISDLSNKLMISSLEYLKAPTTSTGEGTGIQEIIEGFLAYGDDFACVKVEGDIITGAFSILEVEGSGCGSDLIKIPANRIQVGDCLNGSPYKISTGEGSGLEGLNICNQIIIQRQEKNEISGTPDGYFIISRVVYETPIKNTQNNTNFYVNEIYGFRPLTYEETGQ